MKILYLYTELMGYQIPVLDCLVKEHNADVYVIHWDRKKLTPYVPQALSGVTYNKRSEFKGTDLIEYAIKINPDLIYISGWQDRGYLPVARYFKKQGKPVVTGFDDQWIGSIRQRIGSMLLTYACKQKYFSHAWVAGPYQYEFAKMMGFKKKEILFNLLSGNTALFSKAIHFLEHKLQNYPQSFLYVGNFRYIKGVDILAKAYEIYREKYNGKWNLTCVGNGELREMLINYSNIEIKDFSTQEELVEISKISGAFILPSRLDQWGVVVHEFSSSGLPLILSENVGSRPVFLVEGHNGYSFSGNSAENLAKTMHKISNKSNFELVTMGYNSHSLSRVISPSICSSSLVSALEDC